MFPRLTGPARLWAVAISALAIQASAAAQETRASWRSWTPQTSIGVTYYVSDTPEFSPDGAFFFYVTRRGDLNCDCDLSDLVVFSTGDVVRSLANAAYSSRPIRRVTLPSIRATAWSSPQDIEFSANDAYGVEQFFSLDVATSEVRQLTRFDQGIAATSIRRDNLIISNRLIEGNLISAPSVYPVGLVSRSMLIAGATSGESDQGIATYVADGGRETWRVAGSSPVSEAVSFSPDGRRYIEARAPDLQPADWLAYDESANVIWFSQFMLVDLDRRSARPIMNAPTGRVTAMGAGSIFQRSRGGRVSPLKALWTRDGEHVVLVNTALPLDQNEEERSRTAYIVSLNLRTSEWREIETLEVLLANGRVRRVVDAEITHEDVLRVVHEVDGERRTATIYRRQGERWVRGSAESVAPTAEITRSDGTANVPPGITIRVHESMNQPPRMVASNGAVERVLSSPDAALEGVRIAQQTPFTWQEPDGHDEVGGLVLPADGSHRALPLVIQAYAYEPERFRPDGPATHLYAAQSLAAQGFAVLNITIPTLQNVQGPAELSSFVARIDAAVAALSRQGIVDPERVGLVGFSRAGYLTSYATSHPGQTVLRAAIIDDAFSGTYSNYLRAVAILGTSNEETLYGGTPWAASQQWLDNEVSLGTDRVRTPILRSIHSEQNSVDAAEMIGAFARNRRPLEFIIYPNAGHALSTPFERQASYQLTIDWMRFWLQSKLPSDYGRARRWQRIRADWERQQAWEAAGHPTGSAPSEGFRVEAPARHR